MILSIIGFIFALGIIVFIHELGHFSVAKIFGLYVSEFSLGFGPVIYSIKGKETKYSLRAIPIGGFVSVVGEADDKITPDDDQYIDPSLYEGRTVNDIGTIKKMIFTLAGVIMNFLLALAIMSSLLLSYKTIQGEVNTTIDNVVEGMPAEKAGIKAGDIIVAAKSHNIKTNLKTYDDLVYYMSSYDGKDDITFYLNRNNETIETTLTPDKQDESYVIGVSFRSSDPVNVTIWNCVPLAVNKLWAFAKAIFNVLKGLFFGVGLDQLGGPVSIYQATSEAVSLGFENYIYLIMALSLNVGIFNLIPLPAFDGGRTLIYLIEGIVGKKTPKKLENLLMSISMALIMLLFIYVMFKDTFNLFWR